MGTFEGASSTPQMRALLLAVRSLLLSGSIHGFSALPEMQTSFSGSNVISDLCAKHGCQPGACLGKPKDPRDGFTCKRPEALTCLKDQEACTADSLNVDCSKCMGQCLSKEGCEKPVTMAGCEDGEMQCKEQVERGYLQTLLPQTDTLMPADRLSDSLRRVCPCVWNVMRTNPRRRRKKRKGKHMAEWVFQAPGRNWL